MLKPLTKVIKACAICFVICILAAIILECFAFPHSNLIQEFLIGSGCSFIVVIISTIVQYRMELKRITKDSISAITSLIWAMALYQDDDKELSDIQVERAFKKLETEFEKYRKTDIDLVYLTKRGTKKQSKKNEEINKMYFNFLKLQFDSHKEAVRSATDKKSVISIIDKYINCWPECIEKEELVMIKELIGESGETEHDQL